MRKRVSTLIVLTLKCIVMFCYQCQETAMNKGCTIKGVCGKSSEVANLQDLLIFVLKGISIKCEKMHEAGMNVPIPVNRFVTESLFMTITNANFDKARFVKRIEEAVSLRDSLPASGLEDCKCDCISWNFTTLAHMEQKAELVGVLQTENEDIRSLRELIIYGLKGISAYASHAAVLGYEDKDVYNFIHRALAYTTKDSDVDKLINMVLACGEMGVKTMSLLDKANCTTYGSPEITKVDIGVRNKPGILISGHDLRDLQDLLEQAEGNGVDIYTHSEMLPAHYYPAFKKYSCFAGNYGNSWWKQTDEFESFNGPILFTTNCIVPPHTTSKYADRVYTTGSSGFSGFPHIPDRVVGGKKDFSVIIEHAKRCLSPKEIEHGEIIGGFAHTQVEALADKIVAAVKGGAIKKFVVMAGCDGRMHRREYYTNFAKSLPQDSVILTAGCAKYRYNKLSLGSIGDIPRVLDAGQCNDCYSIALIALKLKDIMGVKDINELPIVYNIAWYEQKAVIVLLALLSLGIKNIHIGPTMPAFLSPNVAKIVIQKFRLGTISIVEDDLKDFLYTSESKPQEKMHPTIAHC